MALADKLENSERGDKPLNKFLTKELAIQYLEQFRDIKINTNKYKFTGNDYIRKLAHNFKRNGINIIDNFKDLM